MADNNTNFVHFDKDGVNYFQLYIKCPVCLEKFGQMEALEPIYWTHDYKINGTACGGDIYVGDNAYYYCKKCGHTSHVVNWAYKCPKHSGDNDESDNYKNTQHSGTHITYVFNKIHRIKIVDHFLKHIKSPFLCEKIKGRNSRSYRRQSPMQSVPIR